MRKFAFCLSLLAALTLISSPSLAAGPDSPCGCSKAAKAATQTAKADCKPGCQCEACKKAKAEGAKAKAGCQPGCQCEACKKAGCDCKSDCKCEGCKQAKADHKAGCQCEACKQAKAAEPGCGGCPHAGAHPDCPHAKPKSK
jgi:hypothetical protein